MIFEASGVVTLQGVWFQIHAKTLEEAQEMAREGRFTNAEYDRAELTDWTIYTLRQ